ncbi:protein broad-minded [Nephila pilipes]|uniref:Protein broad-minded n=1 Tax=Nephila pilipes TaxID=299642 RepID=A0A8X6MQP7_NEPPI|nr:protein broad-minded [Nephila pilipes]
MRMRTHTSTIRTLVPELAQLSHKNNCESAPNADEDPRIITITYRDDKKDITDTTRKIILKNMDFKTFVNKESFKAILLQHLKSQVKAKFHSTISKEVCAFVGKDESTSSDSIVTSVSTNILDSEKFVEFQDSFLGSINSLLEDEDKFIPKDNRHTSSSQCSSASSVNVSSIDFLRPDQFQNIVQSLISGTNAEKLEALGTLYRLPTLEHLMHHFSWSDVEKGLHESLASNIIFLKAESLKLYIKMLSCSEPKVVQESYLSLIKYFLQILLPSVNENSQKSDYVSQCRSAVEIISILNKFLQNISTHWLRYPQSLIENITIQSLSILSPNCNNSSTFPIWMCIAICDPEAKWLKSIMHGHVSRASLLEALQKDLNILNFAVGLCDKFYLEDNLILKENCCEKFHLVADVTHIICFLSHLLQYCEGRKIFSSEPSEKYLSSWISVLEIVMNSAHKLCCNACFNCCAIICDTLSKLWCHLWSNDSSITVNDAILILTSLLSVENSSSTNTLYFTMQCFCETLESFYNSAKSLEEESSVNNFVFLLLSQCVNHFTNHDLLEESSLMYLYNSSLIFMRKLFLIPSDLFLNSGFIKIILEWWTKIKALMGVKFLTNDSSINKKNREEIFCEMKQNILTVSINLLSKPVGINLCHDLLLYEESLNILLEKILGDIKSRNSICPCDVSILSCALNSTMSNKLVLNKTNVFRLSSIIWQFNDTNIDIMQNLEPLKCIFNGLLPSIFCDLASSEMMTFVDSKSEMNLFEYVLLFPNLSNETLISEDYEILALQVISLLSSSIHSICVLLVKFQIIDLLLDLQSQHISVDDEMVIDPISVLQNHILVKLYMIGGPNEKNLPEEMLQNNSDVYDWPFITEYPIPEIFLGLSSSDPDCEEDLINGDSITNNLSEKFLEFIRERENLSYPLVFQFLKSSIGTLQSELTFSLNNIVLDEVNLNLHEEELIGITLVERYGKYLNLIADKNYGELEKLLKASKYFIGSEKSTKLDIFVCSIFLMSYGDIETAWLFLQDFAKSYNSLFIWREYMIQVSEKSPHKHVTLPCAILEWCDIIIKKTFPSLFSAFEFHGLLPSVIFNYWTLQCYWNYLDFTEISHFVLLNVLFSGEFSLYFFASVLKHLYSFILQNAHNNDLFSLLIKNPILGFKICNYLDFINTLSSTFHESVSKIVMEIL